MPNGPVVYGGFNPTTDIWDTAQVYEVDVNSVQFKELLVRMYQNINRISIVLNTKDTAIYDNTGPLVNGQAWFPNAANITNLADYRQDYRTVVNFGALPNTGTTSVPHYINCTPGVTFTRIYATASDTSGFNYIPIPFASPTAANNIQITVDSTNVNITTGSNRSNFNVCYVVLEYLLL